jgi:hypothetical protein
MKKISYIYVNIKNLFREIKKDFFGKDCRNYEFKQQAFVDMGFIEIIMQFNDLAYSPPEGLSISDAVCKDLANLCYNLLHILLNRNPNAIERILKVMERYSASVNEHIQIIV